MDEYEYIEPEYIALPYSGAEPKPIVESEEVTTYKIIANLAEIGLAFGVGLLVAFFCRMAGAIVFYVLVLVGAIALGITGIQFTSQEKQKGRIFGLLLGIIISVLGACWDGLWLLLSSVNPIALIAGFLVLVLVTAGIYLLK